MATYYVRQDGNDANTGLGSTTNLAWKTLQKALGATGIGSGDTVYIAPGIYVEAVTIGGTYSAPTYVIGDPTASQFSGVAAGLVNHTGLNTAGTASVVLGTLLSGTSKSYLKFSNIYWSQGLASGYGSVRLVSISGRYNEFRNCVFEHMNINYDSLFLTALSGQPLDTVIDKCIFYKGNYQIRLTGGSNLADTTSITSCFGMMHGFIFIEASSIPMKVYNCTALSNTLYSIAASVGSATNQSFVYNNIIPGTLYVDVANTMVENYNRFVSGRQGTIAVGSNTTNAGAYGLDIGQTLLYGLPYSQIHTSALVSPNKSYGITANAPATDLYGIAWNGTSPDAGSGTYRNISTLTGYLPTERNASTITIAPGSTSQSIELYLGATGLTASTSGLSARYNRTRTASVSIPLVARTIAQAWTAGGFAEVDSTNMTGIYRLDLPDAALAAGADDVTVVVRGASGTNGAVMTVKLSSGGLTSAQTASAVWNGVRASYTTPGTFGEYVNAELVTPVTSAALVRMGPYEVKADGLGASDPLDIQKGAQHGVDIQCVDAFGSGIDITSATVTAKVYNSGATLVDTYSCTATYAADGRAQFTIDTTVTDTPGTYTATITRTTGASDTQVFGPLRIYVRDI